MPLAYFGDRLSRSRTMHNVGRDYTLDDYVDLEEVVEE